MLGELLESCLDALLDTIKIIPFLLITYTVMEWLEHRTGDKTKKVVERAGRLGPLFGGLIGAVPQCGFSVAAASLYSGRVITLGTLIAVFLSTSDEMLPILLSSGIGNWETILKALGIKVLYGMLCGFIIDAIHRFLMLRGIIKQRHMIPASSPKRKLSEEPGTEHIKDLCEQEKCKCENTKGVRGIILSALKHTLQITMFILIITLVLNVVITLVGEDFISGLLTDKPIIGALIAGVIGLVPNCAASVVITQLYLENAIEAGAMLAGLMVGAGAGLLVLFKTNRSWKENVELLLILYVSGVIGGILAGLLPIW